MNKVKYSIRKLADRILPLSNKEKKSVDLLRSRVNLLHTHNADSTEFWSRKRKELLDSINNQDPRRFLEWPVMYPMFFAPPDIELEYLNQHPGRSKIMRAIEEDRIGAPRPWEKFPVSSGNLIHHAYTLIRFIDETGFDLSKAQTIVEFGGGYGSLCRLIYRMGFKGNYIIYDLPEYSAIQEFFLTNVDLQLKISYERLKTGDRVVSLLNDIEAIGKVEQVDLFIALWSLSECPLSLRQSIMDAVGNTPAYCIGFQEMFENINNRDYFKGLTIDPSCSGKILAIPHLPGNNYLFKKQQHE